MISFLRCQECGKIVSTGFDPVPTNTPDKGIITRAVILCPECFTENFFDKEEIENELVS